MTAVRVGFLGAGLIATYHSKSLRRSGEDVSWAGVYDPVTERARAFAAASGAEVCSTEEEVLAGCDAVYVCTWTSEHRRLVEAATARGLAVFCEKPLATTLPDAQAMAGAVTRAGVVNQVGLVLRRSPAFVVLRELIAEGRHGRVMSVVFRDDQYIPVQGMYGSTWRGDVARAGAGTMLEHSVHDLDLLRWIVGPVVSVTARTAEFHEISGIEDVAVATLAFENGALASLVSVWHDNLARPSLRRVEVFCENTWFSLEGDWFGPVRWSESEGVEGELGGEPLLERARAMTGDDANPDGAFIRAVRAGTPAWPDFSAGVEAQRLADAVYRSAAAGGVPVAIS